MIVEQTAPARKGLERDHPESNCPLKTGVGDAGAFSKGEGDGETGREIGLKTLIFMGESGWIWVK